MKAPYKEQSEIQSVFATAQKMRDPQKWTLMLLLSYRLGLRPIELAQLDTSHFRDGELRIRQGHTKGKEGRSIPYNAEIMSALQAHMQGRQGHVFRNAKGEIMDAQSISAAMRRLYREAGQKGSTYSGRRTLLTDLVDRDVNILVVQAIAGHRSPQTTLAYVSATPKMMARALFA